MQSALVSTNFYHKGENLLKVFVAAIITATILISDLIISTRS
jgi:hypothetical protein